MTQIQTSFTRFRIEHTQVIRIGDLAIFECKYPQGTATWYEVIRIRARAEGEYYPGKEAFGKWAKTFFGLDSLTRATNFFTDWCKQPNSTASKVKRTLS